VIADLKLTAGKPLEKLVQAILDLVCCAAATMMTDEVEESGNVVVVEI
jgi:hypothetical protein